MVSINGTSLAWLPSYLTNRKQYISINHELETDTQNIRGNKQFDAKEKVFCNNISLKNYKSSTSMYKSHKKDNLPLYNLFFLFLFFSNLPLLSCRLKSKKSKKQNQKRFLVFSRRKTIMERLQHIENKVEKNIALIHRAKLFLNENQLLRLYFSYIQRYLDYGNLAQGSPIREKL